VLSGAGYEGGPDGGYKGWRRLIWRWCKWTWRVGQG